MLYPVGHERTGLYLFIKLESEDNSNNRQTPYSSEIKLLQIDKILYFFHFADAVKNLVMRQPHDVQQ